MKNPVKVELTKDPFWYRILKLILLAGVLPLAVGLSLKYYDNQLTLNHLMITQGFPSLQVSYLQCANIYEAKLKKYAKAYSDQIMIGELIENNKNNLMLNDNIPASAFSIFQNIIHDRDQSLNQANLLQNNLIQCKNIYYKNVEKLALILNIDNSKKYYDLLNAGNKTENTINDSSFKYALIQAHAFQNILHSENRNNPSNSEQLTIDQLVSISNKKNLYKIDKILSNLSLNMYKNLFNTENASYINFQQTHNNLASLFLQSYHKKLKAIF